MHLEFGRRKQIFKIKKKVFQIEKEKLKDSPVREGEKVAFHLMHCLSLEVVLLTDITK
jgi:hypothetical protein